MNGVGGLFLSYLDVSGRVACVMVIFLALRSWSKFRPPALVMVVGWILLSLRLAIPGSLPVWWSPFNATSASHALSLRSLHEAPLAVESVAPVLPAPGLGNDPGGSVAFVSVLGWIWLVGAASLIALRVARSWQFRGQLARSAQAAPQAVSRLVAEHARLLGLQRSIEVLETNLVAAPAIFGLKRVRLLLPVGLSEKLGTEELRLVILHELAHARRGDLLAQEIMQFAQALHWFNPLVWMARRAAQHDLELACDEFVMRRLPSAEGHTYGAALLKVLRIVGGQNRCPVGLGIVSTKNQLQKRISMIASYRPARPLRLFSGLLMVALLSTVSLTRELRSQNTALTAGQAITTEPPPPWHQNGVNKENYVVGVDPGQLYRGAASAYIKSIGPAKRRDFGGFMQMFDAANYRGKRLRFGAWMKTQDAKGAHIWMRVDGDSGAGGSSLAFDNLEGRNPTGTTDWKYYEVVLNVPAEAKAIALGFFVLENGAAWINGATFEEVGTDVPVTHMPRPKFASKPGNFSFDPKAKAESPKE